LGGAAWVRWKIVGLVPGHPRLRLPSAWAKAQVPSEKGARDRKDPSARPFAVAMGASQAVFGGSVRL
jgi:hypothetical protein